ncbi:MAG: bifunctional adenosylcobinamide kinase/adenosylcobinamide-phosphate guanylyltransferase [Bacteroidales bacterium]|jgi:adenosylcobinamide kinase/adenosylcobinamide-phosphate guanylyltransferase|nr:bifunctional adenosylcobinamide kinase/adenosylcobinamide-phosphate guanylyltransferase [Bacteroidales bacterium]MDD3272831.1 bifunctional adenosylcobinamide kinase/adenosylcobinamide-phosphate guanylyltransferase [Bacteroidales bacterium]MDD4058394.1 bifunctional adenosylcobinamide kinase/adenosylcobinamide-phosphate guanylyltransferase [Bacteroidales bacterium]
MREIIFVTGGQRSGKSNYAQGLAESISAHPFYLATARKWDSNFEKRIERHQLDRGEKWQTLEIDKRIGKVNLEGKTVLLDCITLWLTNIFHDNRYNLEKSLIEAKREWERFSNQNFRLIVVSNEIGMSLHAPDESSRDFTDLQGWMNQFIAKNSDKVILMISGIPVTIK